MVGKAPGTAGTLHSISCSCKVGTMEGDVAPAGSFWLALLAGPYGNHSVLDKPTDSSA